MELSFEKKYELAHVAYNNAYAPYSKFKVGAVVVLKNGNTIIGSNIENASFGLTNCAERSALFSAYSLGYRKDDIVELIIFSNPKVGFASPCGACRQVICELMDMDAKITLINLKKEMKEYRVNQLLPFAFTSGDLDE